MKHTNTISIDQLKPGMFVVGMDQPWYRTPFLTHKRLIRDSRDIELLRQIGVRELKIDSSQGLDVEQAHSGDAAPAQDTEQTTVAAPQPNHFPQPTAPGTASKPDSNTETNPAEQPSATQEGTPTPAITREQAAAAQETYNQAVRSMERMFKELETGGISRLEKLQSVVSDVLTRVLNDDASMLNLFSLQKMKRFDRTLASHALDICTLSLIVGQNYGVREGDLEELGAGALLHDVGYIRLPRNLYRRSHDLTEQEMAIMQQHPELGLATLKDAKEDRNAVVRIVTEHHERGDGSGFPHKLKGDSLSILAQLVGAVDIYDGMVSRRGGKPAMLPHDAIRQLFRLGDTGQYPKDLIQTLIGSLGVYPIGSLALMNTGEQAVVVGLNRTQRLKPVVKVITDPRGGVYLTPIRIDLGAQATGQPARAILKVLDPLHEQVNVAMVLDGVHEEAA